MELRCFHPYLSASLLSNEVHKKVGTITMKFIGADTSYSCTRYAFPFSDAKYMENGGCDSLPKCRYLFLLASSGVVM